jgi:hypothetical protein
VFRARWHYMNYNLSLGPHQTVTKQANGYKMTARKWRRASNGVFGGRTPTSPRCCSTNRAAKWMRRGSAPPGP